MILYHRTDPEAAQAILEHGFVDGTGNYMTKNVCSGVWLSDEPLDENEGAFGDILLEISTDLSEDELSRYVWEEAQRSFREFLIPAAVINAGMKVHILDDRREGEPNW